MKGLDSIQGGLQAFEVTNQPSTVDGASKEMQAAAGRPWQMLGEQFQGAQSLMGAAHMVPGIGAGGAISAAAGLGKI